MPNLVDIRIRTKISAEELQQKVGRLITDDDLNMVLTGPAKVHGPDGRLLCIYLPGALRGDVLDGAYETLHSLRSQQSDNRGYASGTPRMRNREFDTRSRSAAVPSAIIGSFEAAQPRRYCRLTAWSGAEWDKYAALFPFFGLIARQFEQHVPDRYAVQMEFVKHTHPDWVIRDTPFTTITVNNSYPTGVHTDAGDLERGFSNLAVIRKGDYRGGIFTFPEYRLGVDMQDGDLLLMDAHEWHGNTPMTCNTCGRNMPVWRDTTPPQADYDAHDECGTERISVVCYYRERMIECADAMTEADKAKSQAERRIEIGAETGG